MHGYIPYDYNGRINVNGFVFADKEYYENMMHVLIFDEEGYTISQVKDNEVFFTRKPSIKMKQYLFEFIERISFTSYYIYKLKVEAKREIAKHNYKKKN